MAKGAKPAALFQLTGMLSDFTLLVILFVSFRLLMMMVHQPFLVAGAERGITAGGDYFTYYQIASLSDTVGAPFRDWWSEFPPIWSFATIALYQLSGSGQSSYATFSMLLALVIIIFDTGNLILIRKIGSHLHGSVSGMALAWIYAISLAPLVFTFWNFEPVVVFFLLLGLWWILAKQHNRSAIVVAIGALTKFTPALLLAAVWRFREPAHALRYTSIVIALFALVYVPLVVQNAPMTFPSLTAQFNKASYQTVWALLDGNYRTGNFGPLHDRTDPALANVAQGNPPLIPGWLRLSVAAVIGLWIFARTRRLDDKGLVAFVTVTVLIFFLQAQGWSPQWLVQIIPLVLLCFPSRDGVLMIVLLSLVTFTEYPFLFIRTGDTDGEIAGALLAPFTILVLVRTALLAGLCVALYQRLRQEPVPS